MGYVICDGVYYGDRPYRGIGTEGCIPTVFDAHAMRTAGPTDFDAALAHADRKTKQRFARKSRLEMREARYFDKHPMQFVAALNAIMPGLALKPSGFVIAVLRHKVEFEKRDIIVRGALIFARYERRRERVAMIAVAAE